MSHPTPLSEKKLKKFFFFLINSNVYKSPPSLCLPTVALSSITVATLGTKELEEDFDICFIQESCFFCLS